MNYVQSSLIEKKLLPKPITKIEQKWKIKERKLKKTRTKILLRTKT